MPLPDEQAAIFLLFEALAYHGIESLRSTKGIPPKLLAIAEGHPPIPLSDVRSLHQSRALAGQFAGDSVIRLKPPNHEGASVAMLWCRWDFTQTPAKCAYFYGLLFMLRAPKGTVAQGGKSVPAFLGYRFETPELGSNHNYYHCQPCLNMGTQESPMDAAVERSQHNPTWPLAARDSVELLLCVVLSLYGFDGLKQILAEALQRPEARKNRHLLQAVGNVMELAKRV